MQILRQSTQVVVRVGPFMDATDGVTPETGITLAAADQAEALKAAGAATVDISSNTWAAITGAGGWYDLTLTTTDTNTIGTLDIVVQDSSVCVPVFSRFQVIEEAVYDTIYASGATALATATNVSAVETDTQDIQSRIPAALVSGRIDSSVGAMAANVLTATAINTGAITAAKFAAGAIDAAALATDAVAEIVAALLPEQNAAFNNIPVQFVLASDGKTAVTAASGVSVTRSIDGGSYASATGTFAEIGSGSYQFDASAADMNGGIIKFRFTATGGTPGVPQDEFITIITNGAF